MTDNPLAELRDKIGTEWEAGVYEVEKGMIQRFARAVDDPNPLWQDEAYARQSRYGGIIAPPTFIMTVGGEEFGQKIVAPLFRNGLLHGSTELECYQPVRPGDRIRVTARLSNIRERQGSKSGKMVFATFDVTYKNQKDELVARCQQTMIGYETGSTKYD